MIQDLEQIEHRKGMLEKGAKPDGPPVKVWRGARISAEIRKTINEEDTFARFVCDHHYAGKSDEKCWGSLMDLPGTRPRKRQPGREKPGRILLRGS